VARRLGDSRRGPTVLVVGAIHGDEPAGIAIVRWLERDAQSRHVRLWVIEDLNPDGVRADTRTNAHGVDLNRNFPWHWSPTVAPGSPYFQGPGPLSEPESRFARRVILRLRPDITIWFHQHLTVVDSSSGSTAIEDRFADRVGLPLGRLARFGGSATTWQSHRFPKATAFVVELAAGALRARATRVYARAVLALAKPH
jgi:protein MpaA